MNIELRELNTIAPYGQNAKVHTAAQISALAASIREFGFNQPIVVDKAGIIIAGHGRYFAAQLLKLEKVPVLPIDMPEDKAKAYRLADNKLNESEWNTQLVLDELKILPPEIAKLTGFDIKLEGIVEGVNDVDAQRAGFHHSTFILSTNQLSELKEALRTARADKGYEEVDHDGNENKHGAALAFIIQDWLNGREKKKK